MSNNYPVARQNPALHAAPTFRPVQKGRRRKGLIRSYQGRYGVLDVQMFWELDIADQTVLYTILAMARSKEKGKVLKPSDELSQDLLEKLELKGHKISMRPSLKVRTTPYELLAEMGRPTNNTSYKWLEQSLRRLSSVSFYYKGEKWTGGFNMLSHGIDHETEELVIGINPVTAVSIMQDNEGYTLIHMNERAALKRDDAKALHSVLAGLVRPGSTRSVALDSLSSKVWADYDDEVSVKAMERRRDKLRIAAKDISGLAGWKVEVKGKGQKTAFTITRAKHYEKGMKVETELD